VPIR